MAKKTRKPTRRSAARRTSKPASRRTARRAAPGRTAGRKAARKPAAKKAAAGRKRTAGTKRTGKTTARKRAAKTPAARKKVAPKAAARRSTGAPAGAGSTRHAPSLERMRRQLREIEEEVAGPRSSLDPNRRSASAAHTGREEMREALREHHETSPELTGGDVDADWEDAYAVGDEAPGGDNPTPDQDRVDDIGKALGVQYEDNEPLKAADKVAERDRHRWELDPASSEDYKDRD